MPDYPYECTDPECGFTWTKFQNIKAKKVKKCPQCGKLTAKRLIGGHTGILLKGQGWAKDGYK